jgi:polyphosphate kinase
MKMNNLSDDGIVNALYSASEQGVKVDLIVRSICTLRPGVKSLSKNISVRSILGRFLEHSRIYYFGNGGDEQIYIGSADMMPRNLDWRVEALAAVKAPELKEQLKLVLDLALSDNCSAWTLDQRGRWHKVRPKEGEVQLAFQEQLMRHPTLES